MSTTQPKTRHEAAIWVVTAASTDAMRLSSTLDRAGLKSSITTDLEQALGEDPEVVVVDPTGWENGCRQALESRNGRTSPPPAILFCARDGDVLFRAGPAYGYVSSVDPPRELTAAVVQARRAFLEFRRLWPAPLDEPGAPERHRIKSLLGRKCGIEIRPDRETAFVAAVRRRMLARLIPRAREYADLLERSRGRQDEVELLAQLLVVGETYFWRYAGQFQSLQSMLIPHLTAARPGEGERLVRVWSAGCSTGEEVYSLAIACWEAVPAGWRVEVWGTDLDRVALAQAQRGVYGERALRNLPLPLQGKYLQRVEEGARVKEDLRFSVRFEVLNLGSPRLEQRAAECGPFDAIFCRNTLIYFNREDVGRVVTVFRDSLVPGGGLFLGASETVNAQQCGLEPVRAKGSFFFRKPVEEPDDHASAIPAAPRREPLEVKLAELYGLGISKAESEDFVGAGDAFGKIIELRPQDARGHTGLALLLANQGREVEALYHLEQAEKGKPPLAETAYLLGLVRERSGCDTEALQHYEIALQRAPGFFMAHVNRAWILKRLGRQERFLDEMRAAFSILRQKPRVARWVTGGLGWEALLELVAEALDCEGEPI